MSKWIFSHLPVSKIFQWVWKFTIQYGIAVYLLGIQTIRQIWRLSNWYAGNAAEETFEKKPSISSTIGRGDTFIVPNITKKGRNNIFSEELEGNKELNKNFSYVYSCTIFVNLSYVSLVQHQVRVSSFNNLTLKYSVLEQYTQKLKQNIFCKRFLFKLYIETI